MTKSSSILYQHYQDDIHMFSPASNEEQFDDDEFDFYNDSALIKQINRFRDDLIMFIRNSDKSIALDTNAGTIKIPKLNERPTAGEALDRANSILMNYLTKAVMD